MLDAIELINESDRHLEISQLVVTGLNDDGVDAYKTAQWMVEKLKPGVPLHLVAYHPSFKYKEPRTQLETLLKLRDIVMNEGIEYCYLGNVYADGVSNTQCKSCNHTLVERFGLSVTVPGINEEGIVTIVELKRLSNFLWRANPKSITSRRVLKQSKRINMIGILK